MRLDLLKSVKKVIDRKILVKNEEESIKMECLESIHHLTEESRQKSILRLILYIERRYKKKWLAKRQRVNALYHQVFSLSGLQYA